MVGPSLSCLQIMVLSTFLPLVAGRFGLAPTSTRHTNAGVKLLPQDKAAGLYSNDPAGEPSQRRRAGQRGKQLQTAPEGLWGHCVGRGRKTAVPTLTPEQRRGAGCSGLGRLLARSPDNPACLCFALQASTPWTCWPLVL